MLAGGDHKSLYKDSPGPWTIWGDWVEAVRGWGTWFLLEQVPKVLVFNELEITKIYEINI